MQLPRLTKLYLALGLAQAAHSIEEMRMRLYEFFDVIAARFPGFPMRNMSADTFAAINLLVVAGVLALVPFVQARCGWALGLAGVVAAIEILNGIGHAGISLLIGQYMPGTYTAPALLVLGALVLRELWRSSSTAASGA